VQRGNVPGTVEDDRAIPRWIEAVDKRLALSKNRDGQSVSRDLPFAVHPNDFASLSLSVFLPGSQFSRYSRGRVKILIIGNNAVVGKLPQEMLDEFRVYHRSDPQLLSSQLF
jgi:hypothetical protein